MVYCSHSPVSACPRRVDAVMITYMSHACTDTNIAITTGVSDFPYMEGFNYVRGSYHMRPPPRGNDNPLAITCISDRLPKLKPHVHM